MAYRLDTTQPIQSEVQRVVVEQMGKALYTDDEYVMILKAASEFSSPVPWELIIRTAMVTGMRRAELLNATWRNVNFAEMTIEVAPKECTDETWEWRIKDAERLCDPKIHHPPSCPLPTDPPYPSQHYPILLRADSSRPYGRLPANLPDHMASVPALPISLHSIVQASAAD